VTDAGHRELGDNYSELAKILWKEMRSIEDPSVRAHILGRVQDALVERYGRLVQGDSIQLRLEQLRQALVECGFDVEVDTSGELPILREHNCPYLELATDDPGICEMEQAVFQRILGGSVALTQCCLDGHTCCEFQAAAELPS
jgi:predicted ArsR family transcriptional regulator